jgi:nucleotidyltransferase/DNA polymerase involved in DNA repair
MLIEKASGIDDSPVTEQVAKQLSRISTLKEDTGDFGQIFGLIERLAGEMHRKIVKKQVRFRTVSIIIVEEDIETITRSRTIPETDSLEAILSAARELLREYLAEGGPKVRRAGIRVSNLSYGEPVKQRSLKDY